MAELTAEEQILQLQKELAESKKALSRAKDKGVVAMPVSGSYTAKWKDDATGKQKTKKVEFVDGSAKVRLLNDKLLPLKASCKSPMGMHHRLRYFLNFLF